MALVQGTKAMSLIDVLVDFWSHHWIAGIIFGLVCLVLLLSMLFGLVQSCGSREATESELQHFQAERDAEIEDWLSSLDMKNHLVAVRALVATKEELVDPSKQLRDDLRLLDEDWIPDKLRRKINGRSDYTTDDLERVSSFGRQVLAVYTAICLWLFCVWFTQAGLAVEFLGVEPNDLTWFPWPPLAIAVVAAVYLTDTAAPNSIHDKLKHRHHHGRNN